MKVTTVIPAYKSKYLLELLASLVQQTEPPDQVIISDDTKDFSFAQVLYSEPVKSLVAHLNVTVVEGPRKGAQANWAHCIKAWGASTELVHLLCDDDVVYPTFYEQHRRAHRLGHYSASVSRRWYANENGQPLRQRLNVPLQYSNHAEKFQSLTSRELFSTTAARSSNWLGELSNSVLRERTAQLVLRRQYDSIGYAGLEDLGSLICGSIEAPLCFINEHLGYFRLSPDQNSSNTAGMPLKLAYLSYIALAFIGRNAGQMTAAESQECIDRVAAVFLWHFREADDVKQVREMLPNLVAQTPGAEGEFLESWNLLQQTVSF